MTLFKSKSHQPGDSTVQLQPLEQTDNEGRHSPPGQSWSRNSYKPVELADLDAQGSGVGSSKVKMPTIEKGLSTILGLRGMGEKNTLPITNKICQRRYCLDDMSHTTRTKVFTAKAVERPQSFCPDEKDVLSLPHDTFAFKFEADFEYCPRGYYDIVWKLQPTEEFRSPNGFHFTVNVIYEGEADVSGSMEIAIGQNTLQGLTKGKWHYLILEDQLVVHPHAKRARVLISLSNNENELSQHYSGLLIEHIELRPSGTKVQTPGVLNVVVRDGPRAIGMVDTSNAPVGTEHISRLAFSQDSEYLAALTLFEDGARIQVWSLMELRGLRGPRCNASSMGAIAHIHHPGIQDLAIGLSISASGDQLAVFQEPRIGEWEAGSEIPKASFPLTLFLNPLIEQESVVVDVDSVRSAPAKPHSGPDGQRSPRSPGFNSQLSGPLDLTPFGYESAYLRDIVGYCTFLGKTKENEDLDPSNAGDSEASNSNTKKSLPKFVACNGSYLEVFTIDGTRWKHNQTITLSNLTPTLSRRITCKMMIDSMCPTMFMWLEDGGLNCSTWNLLTGGNVSHIHSLENASFKGSTFGGHNKMAISPHESIAALASVDGSLTTYFIKSGMAIDDRKFPGYKIEYVAFHSQDDQLFVVLRDTGTRQLSARILDSLQLRSEVEAYQVPIPTIGTTIISFMRRRGYFGRGVVCSAVGSRLRFHWTQAPNTSKMDRRSEDVVRAEPTETEFEAVFDESISYRLNTTPIRISSPGGEGKSYWLQRVELLEVSIESQVARIVFAFAPEPWTRWTTLDFTNPEGLISAYFMPCGTRFVVVGTQTIQIWNLPRQDEPRVSLQFIFSKPVEDPKEIQDNKFVGEYYETIETATFYQDIRHRTALMELTMTSNNKLKKIAIPGPLGAGARLAILYAFRSVHLLAAMYMFSTRNYQDLVNQLFYPFTFEEHADGIARFVKSHINRMITLNSMYPWEFPRMSDESKLDPNRKKQDVTSILTCLLDERHLRATNSSFIISLLSESNGEWIPRDHKFLNPILRAIARRDRLLVQSFLDYCVANAKKYHPSYLMPTIQCVDELAERYPELLVNLFRRASYISAHNHAYVATHAIIANSDYRFRFWEESSREYTEHARPVFHLRSQLPARSTTSWFNIKNIESTYSGKRDNTFPDDDKEAQRLREERVAAGEFNHKIYVAPFPKLSNYGPYVPWYRIETPDSPFSRLAGMNFFDSPAMTAVLEFKWHKFAFSNWLSRFLYLMVYYGIFLVITGFQISYYVAGNDSDGPLTVEQLSDRYMHSSGWRIAIKIDIALGCVMLLLEIREFIVNGWKYFRSPYNYIDVLAELLPLISCGKLLSRPNITDFGGGYEEPEQIWWMSFSILTIYMHIGGRWDPLDKNFDGDDVSFHAMMFVFFFFTAILLLNLLIALMNDAYNDSQQEGEQAWLKQWSEIMANIERVYLTGSELHNSNLFPDFVYYGAPEEEAEAYESQFIITSKNNLSIENQFVMDQLTGEHRSAQATRRTMQRDLSNLQQSYERVRRAQESVQKNMLTITALVGHCYRILDSSAPVPSADEIGDGGKVDEDEMDERLGYDLDDDEGLEFEDEDDDESADISTDEDEKKPSQAAEESQTSPAYERRKASQAAEQRPEGPAYESNKTSPIAEEDKQGLPSGEGKAGADDPVSSAPTGKVPAPSPPSSSEGPRPPTNIPLPASGAASRPPGPPSSAPAAIIPPPPSAPPHPAAGGPAPGASPMPPPTHTESPTTTSPTELEQITSPTPISQPTPAHGPPTRLYRKTPAATAPSAPRPVKTGGVSGGPRHTPSAPHAPRPVKTGGVSGAPRHTPSAPSRVSQSPTDTDSQSSPYGALPPQPPGRVTFEYGQLPGPSMSMPIMVGDGAAGWPTYLPPNQQQRPQAPWNPTTNPAEMQARIERSFLQRKKRKGAAKVGGGGASTDVSSAAEEDAASLRSLPSQTPLATSSSSSQVRRRRNHQAATGGPSSTPSTLPRGLDRRELLARTMSDTAMQDPLIFGGTPVRRHTALAEAFQADQQELHTLRPSDEDDTEEQEQHHIEYLDLGDEHTT
ncbi:hypothetical protein DFQ27_000360 [Actinomortierella ambigua]|uniref:Ion transport domain-containing protein n=1 Tax=Actinomortierella ambigua TaxID=1343610 RepID=A0A9P6QG20_9FUNG|nr:hypothetical protein DFQ27_000360 [Actinomortierella ambigua]